ncbi:hypothetical protein G9A89_020520 [Geosiphon pyriformis]|nr:hypothetical protein G9A89_020520 [Geosiphon pyriformis]
MIPSLRQIKFSHFSAKASKRGVLRRTNTRLNTTTSTQSSENPEAKALVYAANGEPKEVLRFCILAIIRNTFVLNRMKSCFINLEKPLNFPQDLPHLVHKHRLAPLTSETIYLRFIASPLNPSDFNQIEGVYPIRPLFNKELDTEDQVAVAGNEGLAEIIAVGKDVEGLKIGDWAVMAKSGFGTWRTHAVAKPVDVIRIEPNCIDVIKAATITVNIATAYRMLKDFVKLQEGDFIIQNGANSGVGQAVIQLAKAWGINTINIVRNRPNFDELKLRLESLGGNLPNLKTYVLNEDDFGKKYLNKEQFVGEQGADRVRLALNCVGGEVATINSGYYVTYGSMGRKPIRISASLLIFRNLHFVGFWMAKWKETHSKKEYREMLDDLIALINQGKLEVSSVQETNWGGESDLKKSLTQFHEVLDKAYPNSHGVKQILRFQ